MVCATGAAVVVSDERVGCTATRRKTIFGRRPDGQTPGGHIPGEQRQRGVRVVNGPNELERRCRRWRRETYQDMVQETGEKK